jgi:hypothetical protein
MAKVHSAFHRLETRFLQELSFTLFRYDLQAFAAGILLQLLADTAQSCRIRITK